MAWIELHQSLPGHRKTMRLRRALKVGQAQAIGHLCMLWLWCLDNCPDGDLSALLDCEIAEAAGYEKRPDDFTAALRDSGFLDENNRVHDWYSYAGKLIEKRKQDAERKRTSRAPTPHRGADVQRTSDGIPTDIQRMSSVTVPNLTVPNQTKPKEAETEADPGDWNPFGDTPEFPPTDNIEAYLMANLAYMSPGNMQELDTLEADGATPELIRYAVDTACAAGANKWGYVKAILTGWLSAHITTVAAAKAEQEAHKTTKARTSLGRSAQPALSKAEQFMELARRYESDES